MEIDAKSQKFRLRRHLTSYIKISGRSETRGNLKVGGEFKGEIGLMGGRAIELMSPSRGLGVLLDAGIQFVNSLWSSG